VDLTLQKPGNHLFVRYATPDGIQVVDEFYSSAIILSANEIITDWPVRSVQDIERRHLEKILELAPEVVLIGTGREQVFLPPEQLMVFYERGVGIEVMNTSAACRTFNVLVSESRNVVGALIPG
jgi:uncharacterized protein